MQGEHREHQHPEIVKPPCPCAGGRAGLPAAMGQAAVSAGALSCSQWQQRKRIRCLSGSSGISGTRYHLCAFHIVVGARRGPAPVPAKLYSRSKVSSVSLEPRYRLCLHFYSKPCLPKVYNLAAKTSWHRNWKLGVNSLA